MSTRREELRTNLHLVAERVSTAAKSVGRDPKEITLIAVTKFFPLTDVRHLYDLGIRHFGENRDDEGSEKSRGLGEEATWHFQGQIQGRKIRSLLDWANVIHSLDSLDHAAKFERMLGELDAPRDFFIQINLEPAREDRGGIQPGDLGGFLDELRHFPYLNPVGLMTVPPISAVPATAFAEIAGLASRHGLSQLSMGMSGDFEAAIVAGATHIRVGSSILGSRPTPA
jgi:pyridoxal phosphate enzyme (YggS family)